MACKVAALAGWVFGLSFWLSLIGNILVLCGLAAMQNLCHTDGPVISNSRRLLQVDSLFAPSCSKAYRFQWWGWALQTSFLALTTAYYVARFKHSGIMIIGGCASVLAMIFCNDQLQAMDYAAGSAFSRACVTFVGWLLAATGNFLMFVTSAHLEDAPASGCPAEGAAKPTPAQEGATEVAASTA